MMRIKPIVIRADRATLARLHDEYYRYQGMAVRRDSEDQITVFPRKNSKELG